jgi:hypothetical protein
MWIVLEGINRNALMCTHYSHYFKSDSGKIVIMKGWTLLVIKNPYFIWLTHIQRPHSSLFFLLVLTEVLTDFLEWRIMFNVPESLSVLNWYLRNQPTRLLFHLPSHMDHKWGSLTHVWGNICPGKYVIRELAWCSKFGHQIWAGDLLQKWNPKTRRKPPNTIKLVTLISFVPFIKLNGDSFCKSLWQHLSPAVLENMSNSLYCGAYPCC